MKFSVFSPSPYGDPVAYISHTLLIWVKNSGWEFPGGPVARTWCFTVMGPGSVPDWGTEIPKTVRHGQRQEKIKLAEHKGKTVIMWHEGKKKTFFLDFMYKFTAIIYYT